MMNLTLRDIVFVLFRYRLGLILFSLFLCISLFVYLAGAKRVY